MTNLENAFKNQVYFNSISEEFDICNNFISKFLKYKTMLIRDPQYIGIDVWDKVEPFVVYLVSNNTTIINTPLKVKCIECFLEIGIFPPDDENNYIGVIETHGYVNDGVVKFREPDFIDLNGTYINNNPNYSFTEPVEINIEACFSYGTEEVVQRAREEIVEEEEEEEEENQNITTKQTFKTDECAICLTNPPSVLFCNCGHLCICVECDAMKCLDVCPICKTKNTIKRTI